MVCKRGLKPPESVDGAVPLTDYAFEARYPGLGEPVSEAECRRAAELAKPVIRWAESLIDRHGD